MKFILLVTGTPAFQALAAFAARRPGLYLGACFATGILIRWLLAGGDWGKFANPLWPLFF